MGDEPLHDRDLGLLRQRQQGESLPSWLPAAVAVYVLVVLSVANTAGAAMATDSLSASQDSDELPLERLISRVQERYRSLHDLRGRFVQRRTARAGGRAVEASGSLFAQPPGLMRWEYESPRQRLFVAQEDVMYWYLPDDNQVQVLRAGALDPSQTPTLFLTGRGDLRKEYIISGTEWGPLLLPSNVQVRLLPRSEETSFSALVLELEPETATIARLVVFDLLGNATDHQFYDVEIDVGLAPELFEFSIPDGVDIVYFGS